MVGHKTGHDDPIGVVVPYCLATRQPQWHYGIMFIRQDSGWIAWWQRLQQGTVAKCCGARLLRVGHEARRRGRRQFENEGILVRDWELKKQLPPARSAEAALAA